MLTTHYLEEAEALCGRIAMLKQGRVVALDTTRNLLCGVAGVRVRLRLSPESSCRLPLLGMLVSEEGDSRVLALESYAQIEDRAGCNCVANRSKCRSWRSAGRSRRRVRADDARH